MLQDFALEPKHIADTFIPAVKTSSGPLIRICMRIYVPLRTAAVSQNHLVFCHCYMPKHGHADDAFKVKVGLFEAVLLDFSLVLETKKVRLRLVVIQVVHLPVKRAMNNNVVYNAMQQRPGVHNSRTPRAKQGVGKMGGSETQRGAPIPVDDTHLAFALLLEFCQRGLGSRVPCAHPGRLVNQRRYTSRRVTTAAPIACFHTHTYPLPRSLDDARRSPTRLSPSVAWAV